MSTTTNGQHTGIMPVDGDTFTTCMEQLQEAYVTSVASTAGCLVEVKKRDVYGIDIELVRPSNAYQEESILFAQLKNTTTIKPNPANESFSYKFKKRKYLEHLTKARSRPKAILLVMVTDREQARWTYGDHESLSIVNCCYWHYLEGLPIGAGVQSPSVRVPTANMFDADALIHLMDTLGNGSSL